jgi:hypothetical protein
MDFKVCRSYYNCKFSVYLSLSYIIIVTKALLVINKPCLHLLYHFNRKSLYLLLQLNTTSPSFLLHPTAIPFYSYFLDFKFELQNKTENLYFPAFPLLYVSLHMKSEPQGKIVKGFFPWCRGLRVGMPSCWNYGNKLYYRQDNILWKKWVCRNKKRLCLKCWKIIFVAQ